MARACDICGSRKWRKDKVTGNAVCDEGHVRQDYRSEVHDMEIGGPRHQLTRRKIGTRGTRRNKRKEEGRANPLFYHGAEAEYLRIQALQLLLRLQVQAISKLWSLPDSFEMIVRDLWAYQLSLSVLPPLPESSESNQQPDASPAIIDKHSQPSQSIDVEMVDQHRDRDSKSDDGSQPDSDTKDEKHDEGSDDERGSDIDPEILERLEQSDGEDTERQNDDRSGDENRNKGKRRRKLRISDTIITLVMGLWILRVPFMAVDIENAINEMKIPYVDFYHTTHLSEDMRRHMNRDVMISLSPLRSPSPSLIHRSCKNLARALNKRYGVQIPEMNVHPVIWRIISNLATTYTQVIRLLSILDINFSLIERQIKTYFRKTRGRPRSTYQSTDASDEEEPESDRKEIYERTLLYQDVIAPEIAIVSAWIVIMKIVYGLDGIPREALLKSDPAIGLPSSQTWLDELRDRLNEGVLKGGKKDIEKQYFNTMEADDIDMFLDKAERILLDHREEPSDITPFPLTPHDPIPASDIPPNSWITFHQKSDTSNSDRISYKPIQANSGNNKTLPLMPGEKIRSFTANDPFLELPNDLEVVINASSEVIGWDVEDILGFVEVIERRLERLRPRDERGRKVRDIEDDDEDERDDRSRSQSRSRARSTSRSRSRSALARSGSREISLKKVASLNNLKARNREPSLSRTASLNRINSSNGMKGSKSFS
ncbi:hypothetical protein V866_008159 [Kwoniella sp. B9012]